MRACLLALLLSASCLHRPPPVRLASPAGLALSVVIDRSHEIMKSRAEAAPEELVARTREAMEERNIAVREVAGDQREAATDTAQRLRDLSSAAGDAQLLLLAETKVVFYELLQGRYKWTVYARLTVARKGDLASATSVDVDVPVFLLNDHEREPEAMRAAAAGVAERAGMLVDGFLRGRPELKPEQPAPKAERHLPAPRGPIYFVLVDRFANGDRGNDADANPADPAAFHGGDLQGVLDRLDWLQALGVETVWLSPVFQMRTAKFFEYGAFHGYWVEDLNRIEPRFGDAALLRKLSDALHARRMKLVLDVVLNHVAPGAPLTKEHPDWFHGLGPIKDWQSREELETHDVHGLPDLAQEKEEVYRFLLQASLRWIDEVRPDGFRLDAVKHVPLAFWRRYAADIRAHAGRDFWLLGEALDGEPATLAAMLRQGGFDALFDFPLKFALGDVFCKARPAARIAATLSFDDLYADAAAQLVTLLDNHDLPRALTECGGEVQRVKDALTVLFALRGTPSLQYGTEAGLQGEKEPANRGDMQYGVHPLGQHIAALARRRREHPALSRGATRVWAARESLVALLRAAGDEAALIAVNQGHLPERVEVAGHSFTIPAQSVLVETFIDPAVAALVAAPLPPVRTVELSIASPPPGGELYLVGAGPELGSWNPAHAIGPLDRRRALQWRVGAVYQYKLIQKKRDGSWAWEPGEDRFLFVDQGEGPLRVDARYRAA